MRQVIFGGGVINNTTLTGSAFALAGTYENLAGNDNDLLDTPVAASGAFGKFRIKMQTVHASSRSFTFLNVNTSASVTVVVAAGATVGTDDISTLAFTAGDFLRVTLPSHSAAPTSASWSLEFNGNTANQAIFGGGIVKINNLPGAGTIYFNPVMVTDVYGTVETDRYFYAPTNFTIKSFYVRVREDNGASNSGGTGTRAFVVMVNGVAQSSSTVTFTPTDGDLNVTGLSIPVVTGDRITIRLTTVGTVGTSRKCTWGMMYSPTIDGESIVGGRSGVALSNTNGANQYVWLSGDNDTSTFGSTTEADYVMVMNRDVVVKNFSLRIASAPGTSQFRQFTIRNNGADSAKTILIGNTDTSGSDTANALSFADGDLVDIKHSVLTSGVTNNVYTLWSFVLYINPVGSGAATSAVGAIYGSDGVLPTYSPSITTAMTQVQQNLPFPSFVTAAVGTSGTAYGLYKKASTYGFHVYRTQTFKVGRPFSFLKARLNLSRSLTDETEIIPVLYFDNGLTSIVGTAINNRNHSTTNLSFVLDPKTFRNQANGQYNFFLELQFTGPALISVVLPIELEVDIYET